MPSSFVLEMPPYRRPMILSVLVRSVLDRTVYVLGRAAAVAAPAGMTFSAEEIREATCFVEQYFDSTVTVWEDGQ